MIRKGDLLKVYGRLAIADSELFTKYSHQRGSWSNHVKVIFTDNGATAIVNLAGGEVQKLR
jgi:hypothetical protein